MRSGVVGSQEPPETESAILVTTYLENWGWLAGDELEVSQFETQESVADKEVC